VSRDEHDRLASLLQALPSPEPSGELLVGARRRYRAALEARARREALTALVAALVGMALIVALLGLVAEPAAVVAWLAESAADLARWTAGIGVVLALVPPLVWTSMALVFAATLLSLVLVTRARSLALSK
jgi:hypothetical protein